MSTGSMLALLFVVAALAAAGGGLAARWRAATAQSEAPIASQQPAHNGNESERLIRSLIEAIPRPVLVTDANRTILDVNRPALYMIALPRERVLGKVFATVVQDYETTQLLIAAASTGVAQERTITRASDRETWHVTAQPLSLAAHAEKAGNGSAPITHLIIFIDDETQLRYLETVRKDFVASVSHELRTPLTSVKLMSDMMADSLADSPAMGMDLARRISEEVDHLTELVDDLLELSRIETGHVALELEPTDIAGVVEVAADRMRSLATEHGLIVMPSVPDGLPPAQADGERIGQVLINLIHNAIKFTPAGGTIAVTAELGSTIQCAASPGLATQLPECPAEPAIIVRVRDTGVGIAEEDLPRVFERFFKARDLPPTRAFQVPGHAKKSSGTGLGLAIARHIVEAHQGSIWVESHVGHGSTFSFWLPLASRL
jgi:two-component system phosphate regulon sensor histidine kinase PhoR